MPFPKRRPDPSTRRGRGSAAEPSAVAASLELIRLPGPAGFKVAPATRITTMLAIQHLAPGTRLKLTDGGLAEIRENPRDGTWLIVRRLAPERAQPRR